jgi:predicted transposase YdaD
MAKTKVGGKPYDVTFKHLVEARPRDLLELVEIRDVVRVEIVDAELSTMVAAADKVLKVASRAGEYLVHLEFQTGPDPDLAHRLLWYNATLFRRHRLPAWTVLLLATRAADRAGLSGALEIGLPSGRVAHRFAYQVVRLWQMPVQRLLKSGLGVLPLAPLSDEAAGRLPEVVREMEQRLAREASAAESKMLWAATYFLAGLRYDRDLAFRLLRGERGMKESVTYQATVEEGRILELHRILLRLGHIRFGKPDASVKAALEGIEDLQRLEKLSERLLHVSTWEELLETSSRRPNGRRKKA